MFNFSYFLQRDEDFDASYENLVRLAAVVGDAKPRGTPAHLLAAMPSGFYKDFVVPGCETRCPICLDDVSSTLWFPVHGGLMHWHYSTKNWILCCG